MLKRVDFQAGLNPPARSQLRAGGLGTLPWIMARFTAYLVADKRCDNMAMRESVPGKLTGLLFSSAHIKIPGSESMNDHFPSKVTLELA